MAAPDELHVREGARQLHGQRIDFGTGSPDRAERACAGAVGVAGVAATVLTAWATSSSPSMVDPTDAAVWKSLIVASYVAVGVYTWWRRPDSRLGPIVAGAGFVYGATSLAGFVSRALHVLGVTALAAAIASTAYMYLCYPGGWFESRLERLFMLALALSAALLVGLILAISPTFSLARRFPPFCR
jgi:hypothetical protein